MYQVLPRHWRTMTTSALEELRDNLSSDAEDIQLELDDRERQRDCNNGAMNGLPPDY